MAACGEQQELQNTITIGKAEKIVAHSQIRAQLAFNYLSGMFTREESSRLRHEFWTTFGKYMSPVPSAEGLRINWVNYHTGVKDVYFRMDAGKKSAVVAISIDHNDREIQQLFFEQFTEMRDILHQTLGEEWLWQLHGVIDGKVVSRIYKELPDVSVFNKGDWPDLISFFKPRLIALDSFWENARWAFDGLR